MTGGDRGLQQVRTGGAFESPGAVDALQAAADQQAVPAAAVLVEQQDRLAARTDAGVGAGGLEFHQREQAVDLGLGRHQLGQQPAEAHRLVAQGRAHPVVTGGRGVALVVDQVDDLEHRRQALDQLVAGGDLELDLGLREVALGPDDPLGDGCLRRQEGPGDLVGLEAAEQPQRERHPGVGGQHRVAGGEDEPEQVVLDRVLEDRLDIVLDTVAVDLELVPHLGELALVGLLAPDQVDRAPLGDRHQPGARIVRYARLRPLLQRGDQRVLRQLLGQPDVPHDPRDPGDDPGRLDPPDRVDRPVRVRYRHPTDRTAPPPQQQAPLARACGVGGRGGGGSVSVDVEV